MSWKIVNHLRVPAIVMFVFLSLAFLVLSLWESHSYLKYGPLGRTRAEHAQKQYAFVARRSSFQEITNAFGRPSVFRGAEAERVTRMLAVDKEDAAAKARSCEFTVLFHVDADTTAFFFFDAQTNVVGSALGGQ